MDTDLAFFKKGCNSWPFWADLNYRSVSRPIIGLGYNMWNINPIYILCVKQSKQVKLATICIWWQRIKVMTVEYFLHNQL